MLRRLPSSTSTSEAGWVPTKATSLLSDAWTDESLGSVAVGTAAAATAAVEAAAAALAVGFPVHQRAVVLARTAELVQEHAEHLAELITAEMGEPISAARLGVSRATETLRLSAEEASSAREVVPLDAVAAGENTYAFTIAVPRGVVAAVTPFSFPLNLLLHKCVPPWLRAAPWHSSRRSTRRSWPVS